MNIHTVILEDTTDLIPRTLVLKVFKDKSNAMFYKQWIENDLRGNLDKYVKVETHKIGDW